MSAPVKHAGNLEQGMPNLPARTTTHHSNDTNEDRFMVCEGAGGRLTGKEKMRENPW